MARISKTDEIEIRKGVRAMLAPRVRAFEDFASQIEAANPSVNGLAVAHYYMKIKVMKWEGHRYVVKHGAFWDADVIGRAYSEASK